MAKRTRRRRRGRVAGPKADYPAELREVFVNMAQVYATGLRIGASYLGKWADSVAGYGYDMTERAIRLARDASQFDAIASEVGTESKKYLRALAALPGQAAKQFDLELEGLRRRTAPPERR